MKVPRIKFKKTQGSEKLKNYFLTLIKSDYFNNFINDCKNKYKIPKNGFKGFKTRKKKNRPPRCPDEWGGKLKLNNNYFKLVKDIENFCKEKKLYYYHFYDGIYNFIVYNQPINVDFYDLCLMCDLVYRDNIRQALKESSSKKESLMLKYMDEHMRDENLLYPVSIKISPYASLRDITDYIRKNSQIIKELQKGHINKKIKIGKIKTKKQAIQERNEFIYNNRRESRKKIVSMVSSTFPEKITRSIDEGSVGKIISLEQKRRKEV